jgi:hypothetical protein
MKKNTIKDAKTSIAAFDSGNENAKPKNDQYIALSKKS